MGKSYTASTISIALLLLLLGVVGYFMLGASQASKTLGQGMKISLFLDDDASDEQRAAIESAIRADRNIASFTFISSEQATADFGKNTGIIVDKILDENPIQSSYELTPVAAEFAEAIESKAQGWAGVTGTFYPRQVSDELTQKVGYVAQVALYLGVLLLIVTLSLMYYTLKLAIMTSAEAIRTMQLVGAKNSFIKRPYIRGSVIQGFVAALVAIGLLIVIIELFSSQMMQGGRDWHQIAMIGSALCVIGITLSTVFTCLALGMIVRKQR